MGDATDDATLVALCACAVETFRSVVTGLGPDDLARPTPCTAWDVRQVVTHAGEMCETMRRGLEGEEDAPRSADSGEDGPSRAVSTAEAMLRAFRQPGALDRTLDLPWGASPARMSIGLIRSDLTLHTWDVARAVGAAFAPAEDAATASLAFVQGLLKPEMRVPEMGFGPEIEIPADASVVDRLAAFTGRDPGWQPPG